MTSTASAAAKSFDAAEIAAAFIANAKARKANDAPYRHYLMDKVLPDAVASELEHLPFEAANLAGLSGKRELHNDKRHYFDADGMVRYPVMKAVAEAFQSKLVVRAIADAFDAPIDDTFLRLEYAQDVDGFWLEPHTDLGVKKFTCLIYLSSDPSHANLGTDIYADKNTHVGASPFRPNSAMIFVPSDSTWHGFEKRPIKGVRKSVILNYVTHDWRAREQLSYPEQPVRL